MLNGSSMPAPASLDDLADALAPLAKELAPLAREMAGYFAAVLAGFAGCHAVAITFWPKHKDPWTLADALLSIVVFPILAGAAAWASWETSHTMELRWHGVTPQGRFFLELYVARTICHIPVLFMGDVSMALKIAMTIHHLLSAACFGGGLVTGNMHFWGCLNGCCEISTIFLNNLVLFQEVTWRGKRLQDCLPVCFTVNSVLLWVLFFVVRLVNFPVWLYMWYQDTTQSPATTWDRCNAMEKYLYPSVTVILLLLSMAWFVPLTKGMLKATGMVKKKSKSA